MIEILNLSLKKTPTSIFYLIGVGRGETGGRAYGEYLLMP